MGVDLAEEEQFGPYLVYERLGVGGMATVHRALERGIEGFERIVALKRLLPHLAEDASFIKSFVREAKLASLLNHVNIVQIFELGRVGTEYFISMEYIDGRDIRRILRHARKVTGPPPIHVTVGLMIQLCEALEYAHAKADDTGLPLGLVHRDVSPSNLIVTQAGHLKVIDFGIAKAQSQQLRTQTGRVKGKLAYMAPEAVTGKDLDARSDLFAAGVILHELLTARPLFARKNEYETLLKVQKGEIAKPSSFNHACPTELDAICLRALERDPEVRYATAAVMRDELHALRRKLDLQTGHRDIAQWLTWAFSQEAPNASFAASGTGADHSLSFQSKHISRTPQPRKDEDEAVEIAWGGGEEKGSAEPVVLDDVPDVSEKHLVDPHSARSRFAATLGDDDDIPASTPSHGYAPHAYGGHDDALDSVPELPPPPKRPTVPMPARAKTASSLTVPAAPRARASTTNTPVPQRLTPRPVTTPPPLLKAPTLRPTATLKTPVPEAPARATPVPTRATPPPVPMAKSTNDASGSVPFGNISTRERRITARGTAPARSMTESVPLAPSDDDGADTLRGEHSRSQVLPQPMPQATPMATRRIHPDTLDPEKEIVTARPSAQSIQQVPIEEVPRKKRPSDVTIGASIIQRQASSKKPLLLVGGLLVAGAAATAVTLFATQGNDTVEPVPSSAAGAQAGAAHMTPERVFGTVKFLIEPADAEIKLVEKKLDHAGSPWTTQLEPGVHQIQIQREGYKSWLTSIELSANETQTLRVVLEPMSKKAIVAEASLTLTSTPLGLEAYLDDQLLGVTPIKAQIKPGSHAITLRQEGSEVWRHELNAKASANYEFSPDMSEAKRRERAQRAAPIAAREREVEKPAVPAPTPAPPPPATELATTQPAIEKTVDKPIDTKPVTPPPPPVPVVVKPPPAPAPAPTTPAITAAPTPVPAVAPRTAGPVVVPPTAVHKIAGDTPTVGKSKRAEVPPVVAAKVCIDTSGRVSNVDLIQKLERHTSLDLSNAIKTWRYSPYKQNGVAVPACFVVSFRVQ